MMLNFDMVGSPNMVRFVYDGDNSAFPPAPGQVQAGPPGSGEIERVFRDYFAAVGLASEPTPFSGRSDYGPFITATPGIPAGGLFTGAEGIKTAAQVLTYGGVAGQQYDPCYHIACDTFAGTGGGTVGGVGPDRPRSDVRRGGPCGAALLEAQLRQRAAVHDLGVRGRIVEAIQRGWSS